jgi:hypothetical protein
VVFHNYKGHLFLAGIWVTGLEKGHEFGGVEKGATTRETQKAGHGRRTRAALAAK